MKSTRSVECNHFRKKMYVIQNLFWYVINPKERNIQALRLDDMQFALRTDYILANARLHTNPSDWIKKEKLFQASLFFGAADRT